MAFTTREFTGSRKGAYELSDCGHWVEHTPQTCWLSLSLSQGIVYYKSQRETPIYHLLFILIQIYYLLQSNFQILK